MTFFSSRTFPGQSHAASFSMAAGLSSKARPRALTPQVRANSLARSGTSSFRARGGDADGKTSSR